MTDKPKTRPKDKDRKDRDDRKEEAAVPADDGRAQEKPKNVFDNLAKLT